MYYILSSFYSLTKVNEIYLEIQNFFKFDSSESCKGKRAALGKAALKIPKIQNHVQENNLVYLFDLRNASTYAF